MVASVAPSPVVKDRPLVCARVRRPLLTVSVTCRDALPASTSKTEMALPLPDENTSGVSSFTLCVPGVAWTGASLSEATDIWRVTAALVRLASLALKVMVRTGVPGFSLVF